MPRHRSRHTRSWALAVALASFLLWRPAWSGAARTLTADTDRIMFPLVTETALDGGRIELGRTAGVYAVRIDVDPAEGTRSWALYVRTEDPVFTPSGEGKPSTDMMWKLDEEDASAYRPLEQQDQLVVARASGGADAVAVDLLINLNWCTSPGRYALGLVFTVVYE